MKLKTIFLSLGILSLNSAYAAQYDTLFNQSEFIDIGNIRASHLLHGNMWYDSAGIEFPKGSGNRMFGLGALWMSGNVNGMLRTSSVTYGANGSDYWPGPFYFSSSSTQQRYDSSKKWAKIWKINQTDINSFRALSTHTISNTPATILEWPAKGNPYSKGAGGASLNISVDMAPFVDVDANGQYDPLAGDYPKMKGSQMLWWVINDNGPTHTVTTAGTLMMETRISAYAYKRGTLADNVIFYEYSVTNKLAGPYVGYRLGMMADYDIGNAFADVVGFDSSRRLGLIYNHKNNGSVPQPMAGLAIMELPGDAYQSLTPAGSFVYFNNAVNSPVGDPTNSLEINQMLRSQTRGGLTSPTGSSYIPAVEDFSCDTSSGLANDKRFVMASSDLSFDGGATMKFAFAMVLADSVGVCPDVDFGKIHEITDTALKLYWNPEDGTPVGGGSTGIASLKRTSLRMYPNPANSILYVETINNAANTLQICDAVGRVFTIPQTHTASGFTVNVSNLPAGVYSIRIQTNSSLETGVFVKE
jgi:hypothetical protein